MAPSRKIDFKFRRGIIPFSIHLRPVISPTTGTIMSSAASQNLSVSALEEGLGLMDMPVEIVLEVIKMCHRSRDNGSDPFAPGKHRNTTLELSMTCSTLREICIPFLFRKVRIYRAEYRAIQPLKAMLLNDRIQRAIRYCKITIHPGREAPNVSILAMALCQALDSMVNVQELVLDLPSQETLVTHLRSFIEHSMLQLPDVKKASFARSSDLPEHAVRVFPSLQVLNVGLSDRPIQSLGRCFKTASRLREVEIRKIDWTPKTLQSLIAMLGGLPKLESLVIMGSLRNVRVSELVSRFSPLEQLRHLTLTAEQQISRDVDDNGEVSWDFVESLLHSHQYNEDLPANALAIFKACPSLQSVCLVRDFTARNFVPVIDEDDQIVDVKLEGRYNRSSGSGYWNPHGLIVNDLALT
ncbi:F-box domain-containing protein [Colletotrichum asianum]|uniref:F-box domain-containing protein n=1 Tax=Colletotrichum asianum TaxID=702518 RepID=A0A8H3W0Z6_9PEZI|nr:F-box domain-containing protein [Colletotrichum asianum]